nr:ribonuclease H-like domain-containing protein [Tanacetum cinerariifolium]
SSLLARETLPDVKYAFAIISREESHRGIASSSSYVTKPQVLSFVAKFNSWNNSGNKKFNNKKRVRNSTNNRGPNPNLHCTNCGKVGHTVDKCFDIIGYPSEYKKNTGPKPNGPRTFNANSVSSSFEKEYCQNRIVERKHIHLLNVAKSLLFQSGIPLNMWTECVLTIAYLINNLPSSVLNEKSPFELVYGFKPKLSHLRSDGCLYFLFVLNNSDKFSASIQKEQSVLSESSDNNFNGLNFFDEKHSDFQSSLSPNDDERVYDTPYNDGNDHSCFSNAGECEDDFATSMDETSTSEGNDC